MKTRKPISTISYNTTDFLKLKLEELRKAKIITLWFFISHKAEEDEKKDHKHVFIIPAKQIFTDELQDEFIEYDPKNPSKPLKVLHFQSSNFADWYLYSIHDFSYLMRKGQSRQFHYTFDDVVCSDVDELEQMVKEIDFTSQTAIASMTSAIEEGISFTELVKRGVVPVQQFKNYEACYFALLGGKVSRNGRFSHSYKDDEDGITLP